MIRLSVIVLVVWVSLVGTAAAGEGKGTTAVRKANETISALLKKKVPVGSGEEKKLAAQVTTSVRGFIDIDMLGQRALADHWKGLSQAQRSRFLGLLRELIERNYVSALRENVQYKVVYTGERAEKDQLVVSTEVRTRRNNRPFTIAIDYVLFNDGGRWRAFDVVTDGVGLVENYRSQFAKIIAKDGFDGLVKRMAAKRDQLPK